jgi:hypothetical protein
VNCGGVCWFDYDNDDFLDVFVISGATVEEFRESKSALNGTHHSYLYRNNGNGTFTDVSEQVETLRQLKCNRMITIQEGRGVTHTFKPGPS